jgi:hypothetical protein
MEPLKLPEERLRWAESVGISRERAEWLATCPKFTPVTKLPPYQKKPPASTLHLIRQSTGIWVYRRRVRDFEIGLHISTELFVAKHHRDRINAWLQPLLKLPTTELAEAITKANQDNPDAYPRISKPRKIPSGIPHQRRQPPPSGD